MNPPSSPALGWALAPLAWLLSVTMSAGWLKIFAADPRVGFVTEAAAK